MARPSHAPKRRNDWASQSNLRALQEKHAVIGNLRGKGLFYRAELVSERATKESLNEKRVERWFAELTRKQLQRGVHRSVAELEANIAAFIAATTRIQSPIAG